MSKKKYDTYLDSLLDDSFITRDREYFNDRGEFVVEGELRENSQRIPKQIAILSGIITDETKNPFSKDGSGEEGNIP